MYHTIKIYHNSDCWGEIEALRTLIKESPHYIPCEFSSSEIVAIAIDELYEKLVNEKNLSRQGR